MRQVQTPQPRSYEEMKALNNQRKTGEASSLGQDQFMSLLITQLKNQDPLNPMDNNQFIQQTTSFSQLSEMVKSNKLLEKLSGGESTGGDLMAASSTIGKYIQFDTNVITVDNDTAQPIVFASLESAANAQVRIYDKNKALVAVVDVAAVKEGRNTIDWKGVGRGNIKVQPGSYTYEVIASNANGEQVDIATYSESKVTGVRMAQGVLFYETKDGVVPVSSVYSINEAPQEKNS